SKRLHLGIISAAPSYQLSLTPEEESTQQKVNYKPNILALAGYRLTFLGLTVSYLQDVLRKPEDDEKFGKTSYEDIRLSTFLGKEDQWYINFYYTRYKGLYIDNSEEIDTALTDNDPKIYNEDLEIFNFGSAILYVFDANEYSVAAPYSQTAQQKDSGGSWLMRLSVDSSLIQDDSPIIPTQVRLLYGSDQNLVKARFISTILQGGYGYSLVWNNFYINLQGLVGVGVQNRDWTNENEAALSSLTNISKWSIWASVGYNSENFFVTLRQQNDETKYETKSINIFSNLSWWQIDLGVRF
ncbi:MAG: DUF4421 family protein, partial [Bdellovibrionales bacterium]|nr:DUF4421 family protein [Bdellovibrionales bacterium]